MRIPPTPSLFGKGDPVSQHDPTGRHSFAKRRVWGIDFELLAPDADDVRRGELGISDSFTTPLAIDGLDPIPVAEADDALARQLAGRAGMYRRSIAVTWIDISCQ